MDDDQLDVVKAGTEGAVAGALKSFHELLSKLAGPAAEEAGFAWRDNIRVWRLSRALRLARRVNEMLEADGSPTNPINLKVLLPSLEHASLEEDDYLQDRWAALLANAANEQYKDLMRPAYVEILKQLSVYDVQLLEACSERVYDGSAYSYHIGNSHVLYNLCKETLNLDPSHPESKISLENIVRLGLLTRHQTRRENRSFLSASEDNESIVVENDYQFTRLGLEFVLSCKPKKTDRINSKAT